MIQKLEILVIEDKEQHLTDAREYFATKDDEVAVTYVTTLEEAEEALAVKRFDAIISDVFFPTGYTDYRKKERADTLMAKIEKEYESCLITSDCSVKSKLEHLERRLKREFKVGLDYREGDQDYLDYLLRRPLAYSLMDVSLDISQYVDSLTETRKKQDQDTEAPDYLFKKRVFEEEIESIGKELVKHYQSMLKEFESWKSGDGALPFGVLIAQAGVKLGIPVIACTDIYHHATMFEPICDTFRSRETPSVRMVDVYKEGEVAHITPSQKDWGTAYTLVRKLI
jgi:CheY-like chemotaxis protein